MAPSYKNTTSETLLKESLQEESSPERDIRNVFFHIQTIGSNICFKYLPITIRDIEVALIKTSNES